MVFLIRFAERGHFMKSLSVHFIWKLRKFWNNNKNASQKWVASVWSLKETDWSMTIKRSIPRSVLLITGFINYLNLFCWLLSLYCVRRCCKFYLNNAAVFDNREKFDICFPLKFFHFPWHLTPSSQSIIRWPKIEKVYHDTALLSL